MKREISYREQSEYIRKKRKASDKKPMKNRKAKIKRKKGIFLIISMLFMILSVQMLGILPALYMVGLCFVLLILYFIYQRKQAKAIAKCKKQGGSVYAFVLGVLLLVIGFYALKVNFALYKISVNENSELSRNTSVTEEPFHVYIGGIDVYGDIKQESRSDVNLIATINPKTHKILITTTPRDYYVYIPGVSGDSRDKLTHAGTYGINTSISTLENLYDIKIPFYVRVNFTSVEEIVDVMGGVDVESEVAFTTSKAAGEIVDVKEGMNHFNGKQALAFVRERKALQTGDNQRGKNQEALLTAMIKKAVSPMILIRANSMINSVAGNAETNLSEKQLKELLKMQISDMKGWEIESVAAEGDDSGKRYCYSYQGGPLYVTVPYERSVEEIKEKMNSVFCE